MGHFLKPKRAAGMRVYIYVRVCMYVPLGWGFIDSATTGPGLLPEDPVKRLFSATSRLLLLSIRASRAASLLKPISMISLRARSSTYTQVDNIIRQNKKTVWRRYKMYRERGGKDMWMDNGRLVILDIDVKCIVTEKMDWRNCGERK